VITRSICEEKLPDLFGSREGGYVELRLRGAGTRVCIRQYALYPHNLPLEPSRSQALDKAALEAQEQHDYRQDHEEACRAG
jgi:hypothetical protein